MTFPNTGVFNQSYTYRDAKGFTAVVKMFLTSATSVPGDLLTLAEGIATTQGALTNAALQGSHGPLSSTGVVQYGTAAQYLGAEDKAVMTFQDAAGGLHRYNIPAPKASIFLADEQTIDPGNSAVVAYVNRMLAASGTAHVTDKSGTQNLVNFFGGLLRRAKTKRKYGILQLTPALTPEEPGE